jgi:hypothetical protein
MAEEQIYQPRVMPDAPAAMPLASPEDFGAQLGGALGQAGDVVNRAQLQAYTQQRQLAADRELANYGMQAAIAKQQADEQARYLRNNPAEGDPDYTQHVQQMRDALDTQGADLLSGIKEGSVQRHAAQDWNAFTQSTLGREGDFAESKRIANYTLNTGQTRNVLANTMRNALDPEATLGDTLRSVDARYAGQANIDPELKKKLAQQDYQATYGAYLDRLTMGTLGTDGAAGAPPNPMAVIQLIDSGKLAGSGLTQDQLEAARNRAIAEQRRQLEEQRQGQAAEKAKLADDVQVYRAKLAGGDKIDDADGMTLRQRALALGDQGLAQELTNNIRETHWHNGYLNTPPPQLQARIGQLQALGDKASDDQRAELKWLLEKMPAMSAGFDTDTAQWIQDKGPQNLKPPPLDPATLAPQDLAARAAWQRQASATYGRDVPMVTRHEADQMKANAEASPTGQIELARSLASLPTQQRINASRFIDPGDAMLQRLAMVDPKMIGRVQQGALARKSDLGRTLIDGENGQLAQQIFADETGNALRLVNQRDINAVYEIARDLYADQHARSGDANFNEDDFKNYIVGALGHRLGEWNGAKVVLPRGYHQQDLNTALNAYTPSKGPMAPYNADHTPMTGDQLRTMTPVMQPPGPDGRVFYQFHGPGGTVVTLKDRRTPFAMEFGALNRPPPARPRR